MAQILEYRFFVGDKTSKLIDMMKEYLCLGGRFSFKFDINPAPEPRKLTSNGIGLSGLVSGRMLRIKKANPDLGQEELLVKQYEATVEILNWANGLCQAQGWNPFTDALPTGSRLNRTYKKALNTEKQVIAETAQYVRENAEFHLVNGKYLVATMYSDKPHAITSMYQFVDHGTVDFAIVYNRHFLGQYKKMFVGANSFPGPARPTLSKLVQANLDQAKSLYQRGGVYLPPFINLDIVLASMMAAGFEPHPDLLDYVESVTLGSFSTRSTVELPSLLKIRDELQDQEKAPGTWGGRPEGVTLGSPQGEDTSIGDIQIVLDAMVHNFPVKEGHERRAKPLN